MSYPQQPPTDEKCKTVCLKCVLPMRVIASNEIQKEDHIEFNGRIYDHHAIVVDVKFLGKKNNKLVVQLVHASNTIAGAMYGSSRPFGKKARLLSETKRINLKKMKVKVHKYSSTIKHFSPEEIIERAFEASSNHDFKYNVLSNNCEHFARWCVTDEGSSLQVLKFKMAIQHLKKLKLQDSDRGNTFITDTFNYENGMLCQSCFKKAEKLNSVEQKPIKSMNDVGIGDIITYTYYRCRHSAVLLEIKSHDEYLQCRIAHYAFRGLHRVRKIREERLKIKLDGSVKVSLTESRIKKEKTNFPLFSL